MSKRVMIPVQIPIYRPYFNDSIKNYAKDAIDSEWISCHGKYKELATDLLKEKMRCKYAYLTSNGTVATHLIAKVIKKFYPSVNKIIVPSNCYVAVWNSLLFDNYGWELIPIDTNLLTWNMDCVANIRDGDCVLIVHNLGNIINVPALKRKYPNCIFFEDNCEGIMGKYEDEPSGSASICSSLSFFGNKTITSGEGGAVITNDDSIHDYVKHISEQAQTSEKFVHDTVGYNYRMSNIHAALLYGQLKHYDIILQKKFELFSYYKKNLESDVNIQHNEKNTYHSNWMFGIKLKDCEIKNKVKDNFIKNGIEYRPMFYTITAHEYLKNYKIVGVDSGKSNSQILNETCIILPSFAGITKDEQDRVIGCIREVI